MKKRRLQNLDRFLELPGDTTTGDENLGPLAEILEAEIIRADNCTILKIVDDLDIFPYSKIKDIDDHLAPDLYRHWHFATGGDESGYDPGKFIFFDTETTGLSGGTGMVIFLAGFGYFHNGQFRLVQYFLPDYPDEPLLLKLATEILTPDSILVTYNGKSFDWPMLSGRLTINRMPNPSIAGHLDALHPARSLFRRMGDDCSLITLEKVLLAFDRGEDIPGYLIPGKYFDYLYDRQPGMIPEIIRHNRLDIISLALVTRHIPEVLTRPEVITDHTLLEGVIHHLYKNRRHDLLLDYMERITPGYFEESSAVAKLQYSLALKSLGHLDRASRIWAETARSSEGPDIFHHLFELAKFQEHKAKDIESALETVELLLGLEVSERKRLDLQHRKKRLIRKYHSISSKPL